MIRNHTRVLQKFWTPSAGLFRQPKIEQVKFMTCFTTTADPHLGEPAQRTKKNTVSLQWLQNDTLSKTAAFQKKQNERTILMLNTCGKNINRIASKVNLRLQLFWFQEECLFYRNSLYEYRYDTGQSSPNVVIEPVDHSNDCQRATRKILSESLSSFAQQNPELLPEVLCPSPRNDILGIIWRNEKNDSQTCTLFDVMKENAPDWGDRLLSPVQTYAAIRSMAWLNSGNAFALVVEDEKGVQSLIMTHRVDASLTWKQYVVAEVKQEYGSMDLHTSHDSKYVIVHIQTLHGSEILLLHDKLERKHLADKLKPIRIEGVNHVTHGGNFFYWIHRSSYDKPQFVYILKELGNLSNCIQLGLPLQDSFLVDFYITNDYVVVLCRQQTYLYLFKTKCSEIPFHKLMDSGTRCDLVYHPRWESITLPFKADSASFCRQSDSWSYAYNKLLVHCASPTVPVQLYCVDLVTGNMQTVSFRQNQQRPSLNACSISSLEWHRSWASQEFGIVDNNERQTDTNSVPYTIVHKKGLRRNGRNPVLFESYGCYGDILDTQLSPNLMLLLERGWILCFAHIRGGGELGSKWHLAGTQNGKHLSKDDILAVVRSLIDHQLSKPGKIFARTFSAGSIPLLHAIYEHPEIFGGVSLYSPFCCLQDSVGPQGSVQDSYLDRVEFGDSWSAICPWRRFSARFLQIRRSLFPWKVPITDRALVQIQEDYRWFLRLPDILFQVKKGDKCVPPWMAYKFVYGYEFTRLCMHLSRGKEDPMHHRSMTVYTWRDAGKHHSPFPTLASAMELAFWRNCLRRPR